MIALARRAHHPPPPQEHRSECPGGPDRRLHWETTLGPRWGERGVHHDGQLKLLSTHTHDAPSPNTHPPTHARTHTHIPTHPRTHPHTSTIGKEQSWASLSLWLGLSCCQSPNLTPPPNAPFLGGEQVPDPWCKMRFRHRNTHQAAVWQHQPTTSKNRDPNARGWGLKISGGPKKIPHYEQKIETRKTE